MKQKNAREPDSAVPRGVTIASEWSWRLLVIAGLASVVIWLVIVFSQIVISIMVAILLTALLQPSVAALIRRRWPKWLAILAGFLVVVLVMGGLVLLVVWQVRAGLPQVERESVAAYNSIRYTLRQPPWSITDAQLSQYIASVTEFFKRDSSMLVGGAVRVGSTTGHLLTGAIITAFATIFLLIDGAGIWRWTARLFPRNARTSLVVAGEKGWRTLTVFVRVQLLVAFFNGIGVGLVAFFLGLPLAVPIGVIVLLASFIPVVGAIVSGAVAVVIALIFAGPIQAIIMLAGVLLVHLLEAHVLQPLFVGGAVKVHPLAIVVGVAAGTGIAGVPGALFAVPLMAVANSMISSMIRSSRGSEALRDPRDSDLR